MEEYKDVMLSEPPSRFTAAPAVQSMALDNYKGILLCDRPAHAKAAAANSGIQPFLPAGRSDERYVGMQPSVEERARLELSRSMRQSSKIAKPSAVTRHKRWLKSFATAVKQMQLDKAEEQLTAEERQERLRNEQAELRRQRKQDALMSGSGNGSLDEAAAATTATKGEANPSGGKSLMPITAGGNASSTNTTSDTPAGSGAAAVKKVAGSAAKGGKKKAKPLWAMTEDEALDAEIDKHAALLEFANNLNFEKFIEDYEVQEALAIMRDRVKELATEQGIDLADVTRGDADDDADRASEAPSNVSTTTREVRRAAAAVAASDSALISVNAAKHDSDWNSSTKVADKVRSAISEEALVLADKILASSESMKAIYTKQSLAKLLQDVTLGKELRAGIAKARAEGAANLSVLPPVAPPLVATISAEAQPAQGQQAKRVLTQLRHSKDHVQNLPYMYRCPSL